MQKNGAEGQSLRDFAKDKLAAAAAPIRAAAVKAGFGDNGGMKNPNPNTKALDFVSAALENPRTKQAPHALGIVADAAISRAALIDIDLTGKQIALDHDGAIHTIKKHGGEKERLRGQEPITPEDLALFPVLFNAAELKAGNPPLAGDGTKLIEGTVRFEGYVYTLIAKVRKRDVVPFTMHKREDK